MRRSRRNRPNLSLSLFPFLAVLICTMGVLIVLLVIVVKHADNQADEIKQANSEGMKERAEQIAMQADTAETQVLLLDDLRQQVTADLQEKQQLRSNIQSHIKSLRENATQLKARHERLQAEKESATNESIASEEADEKMLAALETQVTDARVTLEDLKSTPVEVKTSYAIVPYSGSGGTARQPIYIECTSAAIILQPYGIELNPDDFAPPLMAGNPLDAALLTIRDYIFSNSVDKQKEQPYPLLIVRPDGAAGYAMARRAMKSWVDQFGYELVPDDMPLKYPDAPDSLRAEIEKSITAARIRANSLRQVARRESTIDLSQIASDQFGSHATGSDGAGSNAGESRGTGNMENNSAGQSGDIRAGSRTGTQGELAGFRSKPAASGNQPGVENQPTAAQRFYPAGRQPDGAHSSTRTAASSTHVTANNSGPNGSRVSGSGTNAGDGDQAWDYATLQKAYRNGTIQQLEAERAAKEAQQAEKTRAAWDAAGNASAGRGSSQSQSAPGGNGNQAMPQFGQRQSHGQANQQQNSQQAGQQAESLASYRGKDWALPDKTENATLYRRQISLSCGAGGIQFHRSANGGAVGEAVAFTGQTVDHMDELVDAVWHRIESWGMAGVHSYWRPNLIINVRPDGRQRALEIQQLLRDSGLDVSLR